jgi:hypothetical protein
MLHVARWEQVQAGGDTNSFIFLIFGGWNGEALVPFPRACDIFYQVQRRAKGTNARTER